MNGLLASCAIALLSLDVVSAMQDTTKRFYTTSAVKMENAITMLNYQFKSDTAFILVPKLPARYYYVKERNNAIQNLGIKTRVSLGTSVSCCSVPFYRLYNYGARSFLHRECKREKTAAQTEGWVLPDAMSFPFDCSLVLSRFIWLAYRKAFVLGGPGFQIVNSYLETALNKRRETSGFGWVLHTFLIFTRDKSGRDSVSSFEHTDTRGMKDWSAVPQFTKYINQDRFFAKCILSPIVASGWKLEGDAARIYDFGTPGTTPFYLMYSPTAVDHFCTTDEAQRNNLINRPGFNDDDIGGCIYPSTSQLCGGSVSFWYRMYQPTTNQRHLRKSTLTNVISSRCFRAVLQALCNYHIVWFCTMDFHCPKSATTNEEIRQSNINVEEID
ncbi:uncharacterized protein BT62DRAFT_1003140 [Guyanagaster necrorhizus]|uniref:DUF5648 domain-containing protein n=1 Tax=Guyanagaster necrorhizus TaxID=856835 RepID=A0A9P7VY93_9AGAR|nr:uncharacterized protein BT62DRAFT_1003140 [Guyanagaster necrorhizus MCA 3950]KAG7448424.1 hypothetical protein BT62DRAFT_1003140 [Guyanagaster necrorhizus MCA 3950]